jgi:antibiotic biosynthesis monooxygenase (ABM) superfamily enzyme
MSVQIANARGAEVAEPVVQRVQSRPRFALLVFSGVYPLVTLLLYAISPLTADWALWQRTLVLVPLVVVSMVWGLIPFLYRRFFSFIHPERCVAGR